MIFNLIYRASTEIEVDKINRKINEFIVCYILLQVVLSIVIKILILENSDKTPCMVITLGLRFNILIKLYKCSFMEHIFKL